MHELNRARRRARARSRRCGRRARRRCRRTARRSPRAVRSDVRATKRARSSASRWKVSRPRAASTSSSSRRSATSHEIEQAILAARAVDPDDAGHRADDDRRRRTHAVRRDAGRSSRARSTAWARTSSDSIAPSARRRFSRRREDGAGDATQAERAAERRHAARRRWPQHVHGERRVHGEVRAPSRAGGREDRRRLLRHDAGAHPRDVRGHPSAEPALRAARRRCHEPARRRRRQRRDSRASPAVSVEPVPLAERSHWGAKLARAEFVTSVEIVPPRGVDASRMLADVRQAEGRRRRRGERPRRAARAEPHGRAPDVASSSNSRSGIETVTHYACRDRNLLGMLSDLLGASAVGLRNLLLITGDPPKMGPYPERDRRLRHRRDRPHESRAQPESRPRSGRQRDRPADASSSSAWA